VACTGGQDPYPQRSKEGDHLPYKVNKNYAMPIIWLMPEVKRRRKRKWKGTGGFLSP
jgi:hypothetical protein